jgi:hypothetical protein
VICDLVLDSRGIPVSSSLASLTGVQQPAMPGGLMRLSLPVRRG